MLEQFGPGHPMLTSLEKQIKTQREQLNDLLQQEASRLAQIRENQTADTSYARSIVKGYLTGLKERVTIIKRRIADLDQRIEMEKQAAAEIVQLENEDTAHRRKIERHQSLLDQLEEQLARLNLVDDGGVGISVRELEAAGSASRIGPDQRQHLIMGALGGMMLGLAVAFLLEVNSKTFRTPDDISRALELPILAHLPYAEKSRLSKLTANDPMRSLDPRLVVAHSPNSRLAESVRSLRTAIFFASKEDRAKVFMFTSPLPGDGKSTVAANVAASIAGVGKRVLLIDCDLRRPQLHSRLNVSQEVGLSNLLNGDATPVEAAQPTAIDNLFVVTSGPLSANPAEALAMPEFGEAIAWYRERYDYLIIDSPPVLAVSDAISMVPHSDRVVLTLRIQRKIRPLALRTVETLRWHNANIMGLVVNAFDDIGSYAGQDVAGDRKYGESYRKATATNGAMIVTGRQEKRDQPQPATTLD